MARILVGVLCLLIASQAQAQRVAVATFNARGISGSITFTEEGEDVRIEANLDGLGGNHAWHVHELPVDQTVDPLMQCLGGNVGPHYDPFNRNTDDGYDARCAANPMECEAGDLMGKFGFLEPDMPVSVVDNTSSLFLRDQFSIIGRSVVIHNPGDDVNFECATIRSIAEQDQEVTLLQASFINPVAGTVYFRQVEGEDVQMWGQFHWIGDQPTTFNHNWHIHEFAPGEEYRLADCGVIGPHFRPFGNGPPSEPDYDMVCGPNMTQGCEVGDLTGKHDTVTVAATPSPYSTYAFFFTDNFLNLTGENPVINRSVAIHSPEGGAAVEGDPVIACAPLIRSENIVLTQYQVGEISMAQASPFEDTVITSTETASGDDRTSTIIKRFAFNQLIQNCIQLSSSVFAPYDPVEVDDPAVETPDRFVLGDIQNRYSTLSGATTERVFDFPIYGGDISITSLALRSESSCSALIPPMMGPNVIVAKASFSRVVSGAVYLIQEDFGFDQLGNTHVIVDTYYTDDETEPTTGHNWHVHQFPSPEGEECVQDGVAIVGPHYNPFGVSLSNMDDAMNPSVNSNYRDDCSPRYQLRCESGDLTGKHGQLDISPDGPDRPTYTYVDSNVQLTGNFTIIGRSIALHDITDGLPIFDCGTVERVYVSSTQVMVRTTASLMSTRNELKSILANQIDNIDATDILVLNQEAVDSFGFSCVDVYMRVLGPSPTAADSYAATLSDAAGDLFACGAPRTVSVSQASIVVPLLMAAFYFLVFAKH